MAIAFSAVGTKSAGGTTTVSCARPAGGTAGMLAINGRTGWLTPVTWTAEAGWTVGPNLDGGTGNPGAADAHVSSARADYQQIAGGDATPVVFDQTLTGTGTQAGAVGNMVNYSKAAGTAWDVVGTSGDDATHGSNRSITGSASLSFQAGDMLVAIVAYDTDQFAAAPTYALTASGITFGATTRRTTDAGVTTGFDGNVQIADALVSSGSGTVAPVLTITQVTNQCGPVVFLRLREIPSLAPPFDHPLRRQRHYLVR